MNDDELQRILVGSMRGAIAVQKKILAAGDTIDADWRRLGWDGVDRSLDALIERLPNTPRRRPAF